MIDESLLFSATALIMTSRGGFSTNILIVISVAAAMFAVFIISFMVIVIYIIKKQHKNNTSMPNPTTSNSEQDYIYDEISNVTVPSKDCHNMKSSDKDVLYDYPKSCSGRASDYDYTKPASFSMTKINDAYGVVNKDNRGNFPIMHANAAYASIKTGNDDAVEDHIHSSADQLM